MNRKELDGLHGMYEMEGAVEVMLQKAERTGTPFGALLMFPGEFIGEKGACSALVGFCHLLASGYVVPGYPNSEFKVDKSLCERLRNHNPVWKSLADPPSWEEWYVRRYPGLTLAGGLNPVG